MHTPLDPGFLHRSPGLLIRTDRTPGLYGNIGIKVFYNNILIDIFNAPLLVTKRGKIIYACLVPIWWVIAFVIAASIPDYFGFVSVVAAAFLLPL